MKQTFLLIALFAQAIVSPLQSTSLFTEREEHPFEMGWEREGVRFGFQSDGERVSLALEIPESYWKELPSEGRHLFRKTANGFYLFGFSTFSSDPWDEAKGILARRDASCFGAPLENKGAMPSFIEEEEIKEWVQDKRVIFYTGAGLSIASGIPDMRKLEEQLGFQYSFGDALAKWIYSPEHIGLEIIAFRDACSKGAPSLGHHALSRLAKETNKQILTENLDWMHERVGSYPLRVSKRAVATKESVDDIHAVICIGLSHDDKGFLRWMKEHHPEIKIIAVNPLCPSYLGSEDLWYPGDAHEILPKLLLN